MAREKIKLVVQVDAKESELAALVNPKFMIAKSVGRFKYWFNNMADCETARESILNAYPSATAQVIGGPVEVLEPTDTFEADNDSV